MPARTLPIRARWAAAAGAGLAIWLGALLCAAPPWGAYSVSDDWAYSDGVRLLLEHGRLRISELAAPTAVIHTLWGALWCLPRGFSVSTLRLSTLAASAAASAGVFAYLAELGAAPAACALGAALLAFDPVFVGASYTFFTDVPFLALLVWGLWATERGLRGRRGYLWLGSAFVAAAYLSRQLALALPAAAALELRRSKAPRKDWAAIAALPAAAVAAHALWFHFGQGETLGWRFHAAEALARLREPARWLPDSADRAGLALQYLGLALAPLSLSVLRKLPSRARAASKRRTLAVVAAAACLLAVAYVRHGSFPSLTDQLSLKGVGYIGVPGWKSKQSGWFESPYLWLAWNALACAAVLGLLASKSFARPGLRLAGLTALFLYIPMVFHPPVYDRYFLVLMPSALAFAFAGEAEVGWTGWALAAAMALVSALGMRDFVRWNQALWSAAESAEALGLKPEEVAAGLAWSGAHAAHRNIERLKEAGAPDPLAWWTLIVPKAEISFDPRPSVPGLSRAIVARYDTPFTTKPGELFVYVSTAPR
jgi:hypothetical protein